MQQRTTPTLTLEQRPVSDERFHQLSPEQQKRALSLFWTVPRAGLKLVIDAILASDKEAQADG